MGLKKLNQWPCSTTGYPDFRSRACEFTISNCCNELVEAGWDIGAYASAIACGYNCSLSYFSGDPPGANTGKPGTRIAGGKGGTVGRSIGLTGLRNASSIQAPPIEPPAVSQWNARLQGLAAFGAPSVPTVINLAAPGVAPRLETMPRSSIFNGNDIVEIIGIFFPPNCEQNPHLFPRMEGLDAGGVTGLDVGRLRIPP